MNRIEDHRSIGASVSPLVEFRRVTLEVSGTEDLHLRVREPNALHVLTLLDPLSVCRWRRTRANPDLSYRDRSEQNRARCQWLLNLMRTDPSKVKW